MTKCLFQQVPRCITWGRTQNCKRRTYRLGFFLRGNRIDMGGRYTDLYRMKTIWGIRSCIFARWINQFKLVCLCLLYYSQLAQKSCKKNKNKWTRTWTIVWWWIGQWQQQENRTCIIPLQSTVYNHRNTSIKLIFSLLMKTHHKKE